MKRPGPVGVTIGLAFAIVAAIEFRTVLAMVGVDVAASVYYPAAALLIILVLGATLLLPADAEGGEGPDPGNANEA